MPDSVPLRHLTQASARRPAPVRRTPAWNAGHTLGLRRPVRPENGGAGTLCTYVARDEKEASQQTAVSLRLREASGTMQTQSAATAALINRKPGLVLNLCQLTEAQ